MITTTIVMGNATVNSIITDDTVPIACPNCVPRLESSDGLEGSGLIVNRLEIGGGQCFTLGHACYDH